MPPASNTPSKVLLAPSAYSTLVFHLAKYPANAITGLLLGHRAVDEPGVVRLTHALPLQHHWNDLSPMAEVGCSLATAYASSLAASPSVELLGVYHAPASAPPPGDSATPASSSSRSTQSQLAPTAARLAQVIATSLADKDGATTGSKSDAQALVLQVNNAHILSTDLSQALQAHLVNSSPPRSASNPQPPPPPQYRALVPSSTSLALDVDAAGGEATSKHVTATHIERVASAVRAGAWKSLHDFDEHLEDTSLDWLKPVTV